MQSLLELLQQSSLSDKMVTAGFDGFVDTIVKVIRDKPAGEQANYFGRLNEFGQYITGKSSASFSLELEERSMKLGGNMPILSHALGRLGISVNCIGALGHPHPHAAFQDISPNCNRYSFADPGISTALEFNDGKIMMAQMAKLNKIGWGDIRQIIGLETIIALFEASDMVALVNWSELDGSSDVWKGLLNEVFPTYSRSASNRQMAFVDLSDCSGRPRAAIREAIDLIGKIGQFCDLTLGLNKNESNMLFEAMHDEKPSGDLVQIGRQIFDRMQPATLLLHSSRESIAIDRNEIISLPTFYTDKPLISTGAGDNFNAGYCYGRLGSLGLRDALLCANAVSGYYIRHGASPDPEQLLQFLLEINKN